MRGLHIFLLFFVVSSLIFASLFDVRRVNGHSMHSSIEDRQLLLIFRARYGIRFSWKKGYLLKWACVKKGDVVLFKINGRYVIKRCYANDKDSVHFYQKKEENGLKYLMKVGNVEFDLDKKAYYRLFIDGERKKEGMQKIPQGTLLLLGDNQGESFDCKDYGYVTEDSILGKVLKWK